MPELYRIHRLHIIVSVHKNGRERRIDDFLAENYRMPIRRIYGSLVCSSLKQQFHKPVCTTLHIRFMLLQRADRRYSEQREEFLKKPLLMGFNIILHINSKIIAHLYKDMQLFRRMYNA